MSELEQVLVDLSAMIQVHQEKTDKRPEKLILRRTAYEYLKELYKAESRPDMPIVVSNDEELEITSILGMPLEVADTIEQAERAFTQNGIVRFLKEER